MEVRKQLHRLRKEITNSGKTGGVEVLQCENVNLFLVPATYSSLKNHLPAKVMTMARPERLLVEDLS